MDQKRLMKTVLIASVVILIGVVGYFTLSKREILPSWSQPNPQSSGIVDESAIKFLSPVDNEQIKMDSETYTIRWTTNNTPNKDTKVYLYAVRGILDPAVASAHFIGTTDFNIGTYKWTLPKDTDARFGANFVDANGPVKLAMALYPSDKLPPNPLTWLRDLQTKPDIIYSGTIVFQPITVTAKFIFPLGGERFTLGNPLVIKWELPTNIQVSDVTLLLNPIDPTKDINGNVHTEYPLSSQIRSYTWNGKFMYISAGPSFVPVEVRSGKYNLHLGFRTTDGYYQGIDSGQFELLSP